jgi:hypothetical protein
MALLQQKRRQLLAIPMEADIIINLFVLDQMGLVSVANALHSNSSAPAGCRRASMVQMGRSSFSLHLLGRTGMYVYVPSQSGQKMAVKVYTDMYSVYNTMYLSENFILRYTL